MHLEDTISYRAILCRFSSEIPLKSDAYQKKLLTILKTTILLTCKNHDLHLQSILPLPGRLICFFPSEEIERACRVFLKIVGLESISPVISCNRKIPEIVKHLLPFFNNQKALLKNTSQNSYQLSLHSAIDFPPNKEAYLLQIHTLLQNELRLRHIPTRQSSFSSFLIEIEIRQKGVYLFTKRFPTLISGVPIVSKNALLIPWQDDRETLVSALLLLRRGCIITPCVFEDSADDSKLKKFVNKISSLPFLHILRSFYPSPLPALIFPIHPLQVFIQQNVPKKEDIPIFLKAAKWVLLNMFMTKSRTDQRKYLIYNDRKLHYRGVIFPFHSHQSSLLNLSEFLVDLPLFPLIGITKQCVQNLGALNYINPPLNTSSNTFTSLLLNNSVDNFSSENQSIGVDFSSIDVDIISDFFTKGTSMKKFYQIINQIIENPFKSYG